MEWSRGATKVIAEVETRIDAAAEMGRSATRSNGATVTVREWGRQWLERRAREGARSIKDDRSRWRFHVETAPWIDWPLSHVSRLAAREWFTSLCCKVQSSPRRKDPKPLAAQTIKNVLNLVRVSFDEAAELDFLPEGENPFALLKVRRSRLARTTQTWEVARPQEQDRALFAVPTPERWIVASALGTCTRAGELFALRLSDVHLSEDPPFVVIRFTRPGEPTKSGKVRKVHLVPLAFYALQLWLSQLPIYSPKNPHGLVFPKPNGEPRNTRTGRPLPSFVHFVRAIGRHFRWHDLRHTGLTSLLAGWWSEKPMDLVDVSRLAGHSSVKVTESRYVHWLDENVRVERAVQAMHGGALSIVKVRGHTMNDLQRDESGIVETRAMVSQENRCDDGVRDPGPAAPSETADCKTVIRRFESDPRLREPSGSTSTQEKSSATPSDNGSPDDAPSVGKKRRKKKGDKKKPTVEATHLRCLCVACIARERPTERGWQENMLGPTSRGCDGCGAGPDDPRRRHVFNFPHSEAFALRWAGEDEDCEDGAIDPSAREPNPYDMPEGETMHAVPERYTHGILDVTFRACAQKGDEGECSSSVPSASSPSALTSTGTERSSLGIGAAMESDADGRPSTTELMSPSASNAGLLLRTGLSEFPPWACSYVCVRDDDDAQARLSSEVAAHQISPPELLERSELAPTTVERLRESKVPPPETGGRPTSSEPTEGASTRRHSLPPRACGEGGAFAQRSGEPRIAIRSGDPKSDRDPVSIASDREVATGTTDAMGSCGGDEHGNDERQGSDARGNAYGSGGGARAGRDDDSNEDRARRAGTRHVGADGGRRADAVASREREDRGSRAEVEQRGERPLLLRLDGAEVTQLVFQLGYAQRAAERLGSDRAKDFDQFARVLMKRIEGQSSERGEDGRGRDGGSVLRHEREEGERGRSRQDQLRSAVPLCPSAVGGRGVQRASDCDGSESVEGDGRHDSSVAPQRSAAPLPGDLLARIVALPDECASCSAKPGAPTLCAQCIAIRGLKHDAKRSAGPLYDSKTPRAADTAGAKVGAGQPSSGPHDNETADESSSPSASRAVPFDQRVERPQPWPEGSAFAVVHATLVDPDRDRHDALRALRALRAIWTSHEQRCEQPSSKVCPLSIGDVARFTDTGWTGVVRKVRREGEVWRVLVVGEGDSIEAPVEHFERVRVPVKRWEDIKAARAAMDAQRSSPPLIWAEGDRCRIVGSLGTSRLGEIGIVESVGAGSYPIAVRFSDGLARLVRLDEIEPVIGNLGGATDAELAARAGELDAMSARLRADAVASAADVATRCRLAAGAMRDAAEVASELAKRLGGKS